MPLKSRPSALQDNRIVLTPQFLLAAFALHSTFSAPYIRDTSVKPVDVDYIPLIEEVTLVGGQRKCCLVIPHCKNFARFRPVQ